MWSRSLFKINETPSGYKIAKGRISILICTFTNQKFLDPVLIFNSITPRKYKNIDMTRYKIYYNKK